MPRSACCVTLDTDLQHRVRSLSDHPVLCPPKPLDLSPTPPKAVAVDDAGLTADDYTALYNRLGVPEARRRTGLAALNGILHQYGPRDFDSARYIHSDIDTMRKASRKAASRAARDAARYAALSTKTRRTPKPNFSRALEALLNLGLTTLETMERTNNGGTGSGKPAQRILGATSDAGQVEGKSAHRRPRAKNASTPANGSAG